MKRIIALFLAFACIFSAAVPAMAAESESTVSPRYTYITQMYAHLSINRSTGRSQSDAHGYAPSAGSVKVVCRLQQYTGSSWSTVKTWSSTSTSVASVSEPWYVAKGYTYRVFASCYVYNASGSLIETGSIYSNQVTY